MKNGISGLASLLFVLFLTSGCGHPAASTGGDKAETGVVKSNYAWILQNVFTVSCALCHNNQHAAKKLDLLDYNKMMGAADAVVPGHPETSKVYLLIQSGEMPMHGPKLPDDQIQAVHDWIAAGAKQL